MSLFKPCSIFFFILLFVGLAAQEMRDSINFKEVFGKNGGIFQTADRKTFLRRAADNPAYPLFWWTSEDKTDARFPGYRNSPKLSWFGCGIYEAICRFDENGKLKSIYVSFFNRGDAKQQLSESDFNNLIKKLDTRIAKLTGTPGKLAFSGKLTAKNIIQSKVFEAPPLTYILKSGKSRRKHDFQAEFVQLEVERFESGKSPALSSGGDLSQVRKTAMSLPSNIRKEEDGSVFIDKIPMVDQGEKGYCAVAVLERILRYYGNENVNQHQMAQVASSGAERGTNLDDMLAALRRCGAKFGVRARERFKRIDSMKDIDKLLKKYNKFAKKAKKPQLQKVIRGNILYVSETLASADLDVWRDMRLSEKGDYRKFMSAVRDSVLRGIPLVWCVQLGIVPEKGLTAQTAGGHMRLIIGYNDQANPKTLIYSDTWGMGHEKKNMSQDDAWLISDALLSVDPRK